MIGKFIWSLNILLFLYSEEEENKLVGRKYKHLEGKNDN